MGGPSTIAPLSSTARWFHDLDVKLIRTPPTQVLLCTGPRCTRRGALGVLRHVREAGVPDGVSVAVSGCQGACAYGPNLIATYPGGGRGMEHAAYRGMDGPRVRAVAEALAAGEPLPEAGRPRDAGPFLGGT
jgi:(2Fe-2S) ferredoxin